MSVILQESDATASLWRNTVSVDVMSRIMPIIQYNTEHFGTETETKLCPRRLVEASPIVRKIRMFHRGGYRSRPS